jgi:hypothetical protein
MPDLQRLKTITEVFVDGPSPAIRSGEVKPSGHLRQSELAVPHRVSLMPHRDVDRRASGALGGSGERCPLLRFNPDDHRMIKSVRA